jgi:hypothetical protein
MKVLRIIKNVSKQRVFIDIPEDFGFFDFGTKKKYLILIG